MIMTVIFAHLHGVDGGLCDDTCSGARQETLDHMQRLPIVPIEKSLHLVTRLTSKNLKPSSGAISTHFYTNCVS